jgi:hypothetical protein
MTPKEPPPPPFPDWAYDSPRPTPPPPPRKRRAFITYDNDIDEIDEYLAHDGRLKMKRAIRNLLRAGLSPAEIEREFWAAMRDRNN